MFKEKSSKKRVPISESSKELTLDARHHKMIDSFHTQSELIQSLKDKYAKLLEVQASWKLRIHELYLQQLDNPDNPLINEEEYQLAWSSNLEVSDELLRIDKQMKVLQNSYQEIQYFERTGKILFEYYDLLENQHQQVDTNPITSLPKPSDKVVMKGRKRNMVALKGKNILEAFQIFTDSKQDIEDQNNYDGMSLNDNTDPIENDSIKIDSEKSENIDIVSSQELPQSTTDKRSLVEQYMSIVDTSYIRPLYQDIHLGQCSMCSIPLTYLMQDGIMVCQQCGYQELLLVEQNKPIYRQPSKEASHFSYKRINHFNEWISQIQGKESTDIPEDIFDKIVAEIKKEKIIDNSKLSYHKMREILKKLKINKYYEHIHYIISRINGQPTPNFSPDLEEKLRSMFKEIQGPFLKHCPKDRKNFLSYSYVLYKFFQLLEKDEYLKHFPLLKSREKLHLQDQIWRKICEELNWQFIESI